MNVVENSQWNQLVADVVSALGTPLYMERLIDALRFRVEFNNVVMFGYRGDSRPIDLYDDFSTAKRRIFVSRYQEGPYLLDPFFLGCANNVEDGLYRLKQLAADRFYQSEYFRSYYGQTGLSEEIGYFVGLPNNVTVVISLMRSEQSTPFNAREFRQLNAIEPIVRSTVAKQWAELDQRFECGSNAETQSGIQKTIDEAFHTFGKSVLTPRERDVVEYVLKGHSSEATAKILGITAGTVRIHRKNIYTKLRINSQGELFSTFITALTS